MSLLCRTTDVVSTRTKCCSPGPDFCRGILPHGVVRGQHTYVLHNRSSVSITHQVTSSCSGLHPTPTPTEKNKASAQVHHDAHRVFITLAAYTSGREVEVQRNRSRKERRGTPNWRRFCLDASTWDQDRMDAVEESSNRSVVTWHNSRSSAPCDREPRSGGDDWRSRSRDHAGSSLKRFVTTWGSPRCRSGWCQCHAANCCS